MNALVRTLAFTLETDRLIPLLISGMRVMRQENRLFFMKGVVGHQTDLELSTKFY